MSDDEKNAFLSSHHELAGPALVARLTESVKLSKKLTTKTSFNAAGKFMDEAELQEAYGKRPDVLANIPKNAPKMYDPI
eukprot:6889791-Alexandrium_andersonii.AAC.1